ncbi:MAG: WG repeat-containing protein, partial [Ginsengibacter sp.]
FYRVVNIAGMSLKKKASRGGQHHRNRWSRWIRIGGQDGSEYTLITETEIINNVEKTKRWESTEPPAFHDNLMLTRRDTLYGYADTSGKVIIPFQYLEAGDFSDGVAIVTTKQIERHKLQGDDAFTRLYNSIPEGSPSYHWSVIDTKGNIVFNVSDSMNIDSYNGFSNGLAAFFIGDGYDSHYGIINTKGQTIFKPQFYREPMKFSDGLSFVQIDGHAEGNKDGHILILDTTGEVISKIQLCKDLACIYDSKLSFHEGLLAIKINSLWGNMDKMGKLIIKPQF